MQSYDHTSAGHNGQVLDFLPVHVPQQPKKVRFAKTRATVRQWWNDAWNVGGVLHALWDDIRWARIDGWHGMANWLKTLLTVTGLSIAVLAAKTAATVVLDSLHQLLTAAPKVEVATDTSSGVWAVIDQPVRTYIAQHSAGLAISGSTVYTLWQLTAIVALVLGFLSRNNGVRLTWATHGAATVWMVWTTTPHASRTVAAALAVLAWTLLSAFALRGMTLRRRVAYHARPARAAVRPAPHVPPQAAPADGDFDDDVDSGDQLR